MILAGGENFSSCLFFSQNKLTSKRSSGIIIFVADTAMRDGSIAQLGEHLPYKQRVTGSSPVVPTNMVR